MIDPASLLKVFKASPVPGLLLQPNAPVFTIVEVTKSLSEICGNEGAEVSDRGFFEVFFQEGKSEASEYNHEIRKMLRQAIEEKAPQQGIWPQHVGYGSEKKILASRDFTITPILSEAGEISYIFLCFEEPRNTPLKGPGTVEKIAESSLDVICGIDDEGRFLTVNTAAERLWGYPVNFLPGRKFLDFVYEPDIETTMKSGLAVKEGKNLRFFENRIVCKNGKHMTMVWSAKWDEEDRVFYCIGKDATEKKKAEFEMQLMIDNTDEAFVLLDKNLLITAYNRVFFRLYKHFFGKEIKKEVSILEYAIADNQSHLLHIYESVLQGEIKTSEITVPFPNKPPRVFVLKYKPARNSEDEVMGVFITIKDVTEATLAKQKLEASEEKYRMLFYNSPKAMWIYDLETFRILDVNDTAVQNYGYSHNEFCNQTVWDLRADKDFQKILALQQEVQEKDGRIYFGKDLHSKKDGRLITVELFGFRISYDQKEAVVVVSSDITDKERIIEQLKANEAKLLTAQKIARLGYWQLQVQGKEFYWSDEIYNIWGVSKEGFDINRDSLKTIHPEDIDLFFKHKEALIEGRGWVDFEHRIILPDGSVKWVHEKGEVIKDENGEPVIIEGTVQDITEAKLLELSLAESNQRYEYVTKATSDAIWDWNLITDEIFWGEGFNTLFGYDISQLNSDSSSWKNNIHPDDYERIQEEVNTVIRGADSFWTNEYRFKKADNNYAFVLDRGFVIRDDKGNAIRMVGSLQDISRQKEEEHRLKLLESVVTNTSDGVLILEVGSQETALPRIIYANEALCQMTGYSSDELIGKSLASFERAEGSNPDFHQLLEAFGKRHTFERTAIVNTKSGDLLWVNTTYNPVSNKAGEFFQWVSINRNVTQRKNEETKKALLAEVSQIFNGTYDLKKTLQEVLKKLESYGDFSLAEIWLTGFDRNQINLAAWHGTTAQVATFYSQTADLRSFEIGKGFPGVIWQKEKVQLWKAPDRNERFLRRDALERAGIDAVLGFPLIYNDEVIGALVLGFDHYGECSGHFKNLFESFTPHLSAEIKRKQLERDLNQIFEFSPDMICIVGNKGYCKKTNPAMSRILEYSQVELLSVPMDDFVHPDDKQKTVVVFKDLLEGKNTDYFENRLISKSGKIFWLAWTATSGTEEGSFFCIAKDISEKKKLEHLLNEANRLARIGSWEFNIRENRLFWSDITKEIHGYDASFTPSPSQGTDHCKSGKDKELLEQAVANAMENATGWDLEIQIITADGKEKWVRTIGEVEYFEEQPYRIYGSMQDIDARKRAEEALRKTNEVHAIISKTINDSIWEWDVISNEITRPGKKLEPLLGYEDVPPEEVSTFFHSRIKPSDKERLFSKLWEYVNDPTKTYYEDEYRILRADGKYATIYDRAFILRDESGKAIRMIGSSQDISKLKENEIQLKSLNEALEKHVKDLAASNAELEQFAYIASHDLQEPLRMVTSFLSQIEKKYGDILDEKGRQYIYYAVDGAKRMRQIILDLLEFSRVGRTEDDLEEIDVNELLEEISILFNKHITETSATVSWSLMPAIKAFRSPLRQVFQNLIGNALKYQKPDINPVIQIGFEEQDRYWKFWVSDNGIGIDAEYFERIFVIFQRLHNKDEYSGTGIGLAIVKKIVENMGGKIWIESELGKGTIFYFTIAK